MKQRCVQTLIRKLISFGVAPGPFYVPWPCQRDGAKIPLKNGRYREYNTRNAVTCNNSKFNLIVIHTRILHFSLLLLYKGALHEKKTIVYVIHHLSHRHQLELVLFFQIETKVYSTT